MGFELVRSLPCILQTSACHCVSIDKKRLNSERETEPLWRVGKDWGSGLCQVLLCTGSVPHGWWYDRVVWTKFTGTGENAYETTSGEFNHTELL